MKTIDNGTFPIHAYSKQELANAYFPTASSSRVAVNHLMAWVHRCTPLWEGLAETGYNRCSKYFTSKQVMLIVEHLGEP